MFKQLVLRLGIVVGAFLYGTSLVGLAALDGDFESAAIGIEQRRDASEVVVSGHRPCPFVRAAENAGTADA